MINNDSVAFLGDVTRLYKFTQAARKGGKLTVGFIGGSITQGSLATIPENCYAAKTVQWLREKYPASEFAYVNAGVGGTTSHFGVARVEDDLLYADPNLVIIEFSVNDENTLFYRETYEGLIRKVMQHKSRPAVILLHNVMYADGTNAQDQHETCGRYYLLPCISAKSTIYQRVAHGALPAREITPDLLHPNDKGHAMVSELLTSFIEKVGSGEFPANQYSDGHDCDACLNPCHPIIPNPFTDNAYETARRVKSDFMGRKKGDFVEFELSGTELAAQFIRYVKHPACIAKAVIDGCEEKAVILDANFTETWGDKLDIEVLTYHGEPGKHTVRIEVIEGDETCVPFKLVSIIVS